VLPHMRAAGAGLLLWVGSTTSQVPPPFLGPYVAAKAAMDGLAAVTAYEVAPLGIETAMVVPGAFTSGTEHFANAGHPADGETVAAYAAIAGLLDQIQQRLEALTPADADVQAVADEIARVVDLPAGERPMRTVVDPIDDGAGAVIDVMVERRTAFMGRLGLEQMLHPVAAGSAAT
jgi:NAD(P)-dependent dehydrogenase (short-subunit alcohol dehydrogenase family)